MFDQSLDGKNLEVVLLEFGIRIQRVIYDHVQQFVISENGEFSCTCISVPCHGWFSLSVVNIYTHRSHEYHL